MPKLKVKVESMLEKYLTNELTDEGFKDGIRSILNEFKGKSLLHQNIGQLTWMMEKGELFSKDKFDRIWILFDQVSPRIREDFRKRTRNGPSH